MQPKSYYLPTPLSTFLRDGLDLNVPPDFVQLQLLSAPSIIPLVRARGVSHQHLGDCRFNSWGELYRYLGHCQILTMAERGQRKCTSLKQMQLILAKLNYG